MKRLLVCLVACLMLCAFVGCNKEEDKPTEESSTIEEGSGGITGDKTISDVDAVSEDEAELQTRLQLQAETITAANTDFSERYLDMRAALLASECTFKFDNITQEGIKYSYVYVNKGDDWYYYMTVTDKNGKKSEAAYLEKDGVGYSFDYDKKMCVTVPEDQKIRKRTDILPVISGIHLKEQTIDIFNGNKYDCDVYERIATGYTEDMKNLEPREAGTLKVYFSSLDSDGKQELVGMSFISDVYEGYTIVVTGFTNKADDTVLSTTRDGFKSVSVEEYLMS